MLTQLHSAEAVSQDGLYTWIVSGCLMGDAGGKAESAEAVSEALARSGPKRSVELHFTPSYSDMSVYGGPHADGTVKRTFVNRQGKVIKSPYGNR